MARVQGTKQCCLLSYSSCTYFSLCLSLWTNRLTGIIGGRVRVFTYLFIFNYKCELTLGRSLTSAEKTEKDPGTRSPQLPHSEQLALLALDENLGKFLVNFNGIQKYVVQ